MTTQSEQTLENNLISQLVDMGYERVIVPDEPAMITNLRTQLELHDETTFSDSEFERILNHLNKGGVFDRAQTLREKFSLLRDDGTHKNIEFLNMSKWCQNRFQVANQITQQGSYQSRYDVTILINGLPLVHIELKRRGIELKEAFNQVNRYRRHSFASSYGLFQFVQLFVVSNGGNTKYYSNTVGYMNPHKTGSFKFTSFWTNKDNKRITELEDFAKVFLEKCHVAKMITKYMVLNTEKQLLALRPYQYYAVEAIVDKVQNEAKGGYIWHTTGSGKTLTSFKASQLLMDNPSIYKVIFVVDRNDLDNQTIREFNSFKADSVDPTTNTRKLVKQFANPDEKLIVTTIQKLNTAISRERHLLKMDEHRDKRVIFIFDECHRSQFGETHKRITEYFTNYQLFGFTGTPIFVDNASGNSLGKRTTKVLFGDCLHKYIITDAIHDENVLKFSVEYYKNYSLRNSMEDSKVQGIDTQEVMEAPPRLEMITDFIIQNHNRKTKSRDFSAMFAVSNVDTLTRYYEILRHKQAAGEHNLRIATIFSFGVNEEDKDADGMLDDDPQDRLFNNINEHTRDKLESYIADYNKMFGTSYTTKDTDSFYNYYRNIADRVKAREIDILLVVNMFLTGFDSKTLNTLYVDKNLRYHGLLQAYSRTNRILNETKSQGNIVVFRPGLKNATDEALELFANKDAKEDIFLQPYEDYVKLFNTALEKLYSIAATPAAVDDLYDEDSERAFVEAFRQVLRLRNVIVSFSDFSFEHVNIDEQTLENYKGKYLDIYDKVRNDAAKEKVSILDDIDFELELTRRDEINVSYILRLIARMVGANSEKQIEIKKTINDTLANNVELRSKRELIEKFIRGTLPDIADASDVDIRFAEFVSEEQAREFREICRDQGLNPAKTQILLDRYVSTGRLPQGYELSNALTKQPSVLLRSSILSNATNRIKDFIQTFIEGM